MIKRAYKYRIYPNKTQSQKLANAFGCARFVPRFYPSSKTCSACGTVKKDLTLKERTFDCQHCGTSLDRDYNAAINLNRKAAGVHTA